MSNRVRVTIGEPDPDKHSLVRATDYDDYASDRIPPLPGKTRRRAPTSDVAEPPIGSVIRWIPRRLHLHRIRRPPGNPFIRTNQSHRKNNGHARRLVYARAMVIVRKTTSIGTMGLVTYLNPQRTRRQVCEANPQRGTRTSRATQPPTATTRRSRLRQCRADLTSHSPTATHDASAAPCCIRRLVSRPASTGNAPLVRRLPMDRAHPARRTPTARTQR